MKDKKIVSKDGKQSLIKVLWFSIAASALLLVTNSAIWINNQVFNTTNFTQSVTTSLTSESSRTAIAQQITDSMFADRAIARRIAGDFSVKILSGLLDTDQFEKVLTNAVVRMQVYVTSSNQENISIDFRGAKDIITKLTNVTETLGKDVAVNTDNIPDQIVLINEEDVPDIYAYGVVLLWLAPITFVIALALLAYPYLKRTYDYRKIIMLQGVVIAIASLLGLLIGPLFKPLALAGIKEPNSRVVVANIYDTFIATFNTQTLYLFGLAVLAIVASIGIRVYPTVKQLATKKK